ncbi:HXXEE domain-containing protein [Haloferax sp. MBLA0076]|uniref:HXXEE domain-containing protein n=1 Tax=Haloferax litoreum TaxID=2666140 RepID=A0A6A8GGN5_9EURY|nr:MULTISPECIES: HXXEE domain-containing protein [Haloferax]KAB1193514.1 HXXEE domain-containing protein [Haloferax sp. CBA1148]MRX22029.1 HXXEE domain-containing protein [Haloferax litoreum]
MSSVVATESLAWMWLLPVSWLVHDVEEILTIERWSRRSTRWVETNEISGLQRRLVDMLATTRRQFSIAVGIVGIVFVVATIAGVSDLTGVGILVYTAMLGGYFAHAFVHLGQSLVVRGYTPGVVTAVVVVIPASLALYRRLFSTGLVGLKTATVTGIVGVVLFVPVVVGAGRLAGRIAGEQ